MKYKLQDLIDMEHFQNLQDRLDEIYSFPSSIIDNDGNILTATAWQDICTQFHRKNKDCEKLCIKSDQYIKDHILEANPAVSYRCPHGLVDNATPIIIDGFHYGNFFTGQFFLEEPDMEFFRTQAKKYGFDEDSYLKAVKRVPIWTQEKLNSYLFFIKGLITIISESGLKKLKETENRKLIEAGENRHRSIIKSAMDGYWLTDTDGRLLEVNEAYCRMSGYSEDELLKMSIPDLEANEDSQLAAEHMQKVIFQGSDRFESKHRSKDGTVFNIEVSTQFRPEEGGQCVCFLRDITERKQAEKSIRISEKKYRTLFENMTQGVFYQRADGVLIEYNNATLEMFGLTSDQFIGRTSFDPQWKVITEDGTVLTVDKHPSMVALQTGKPVRDAIVGVYNPLKKYYNWLIVNAIPQFNKAGEKPYQVFVTLQDITERKKAESDLFQQKQFLQKAQEIGKIGTWELDIQKNELLWTDENYKIFGIPIGTKLTYEIFLECVHPDDREYVDTEWKAAFTGKPYDIVHRLIVDGKTKWVREKAEIIFNELGGCIKGTGFTQDITGQKKSEIEKIKEKQKAENYLNMAGVMFVGLDKDGNINLANKKACQILDGQQEEILGLNWFDNFIPQHIRHEVHSVYEKLINGNIKPVEYYENLIITNSGKEKHIAWHNSVLRNDDGNIIGVLCSGEDITEKKQLAAKLQQAQKMESIGTLAGGIAHDFNNILSSIIGFTELAIDGVEKGSEIEDDLKEVRSAGMRAKDLVKQILTFARQSDESVKPIQVSIIVKEVLKFIKSSIPVTIEINEKLNSDSFVMGSPTQIHQVLMNLCTNAAQAMEENGGILELSVNDITNDRKDMIPDLKSGEYIEIKVTDTGMGIPANHIHSIFEPYFTTKPVGEGTGMGLAVAHGIVESNGGQITVDSTVGKGTCFTVYLPIAKKRKVHIQSEKENLPLGNENILFVDDEAPIAKMGSKLLEQLGYTVTTRSSSIEALELFRSKSEDFDLVVTDMTMPNMTGDKLAAELMQIRSDIPVILCTGYSKKISEESVAEIGIKAFVYKPVVKADLAKTVRNVLDEMRIPAND